MKKILSATLALLSSTVIVTAEPSSGTAPSKAHVLKQSGEFLKAADENGDGKLDEAELAYFAAKRAARHFSMLDTDNDGFVTKEELQASKKAGWAAFKKDGPSNFQKDITGTE